MSFAGFSHRDVEAEVREILRARGVERPTVAECKEWVRRLIKPFAPHWSPGDKLDLTQAIAVGDRFNAILAHVRGKPYDD